MIPEIKALPNGLRVVLAPCEAESVAVGVFVESGSRHEPKLFAGISHFIEHMLFKGTKTRSQLDITQAIEGRGGNFNACTSEEATCYYVHLPSDFLGEALDILADMFLRAAIPDDEFEREKSVVLEEIKMYSDDPDAVAQENLQRALFPHHPLGRPIAGSAQTLNPLRPSDLRSYILGNYRADNTIVVIAGAFDPEIAFSIVSSQFSSLKKDPSARSSSSCYRSFLPPVASTSVRKEVQQTQLALGYRTFGIGDERKYAATVMDAILGRGMSSRLFQEVREKRGLSYDICSRMQFFREAGQFGVFAGVPSDKADQALATIDRQLLRLTTTRVPKSELERTKEFLIGNFRLAHESVRAKLFFYGHTVQTFGRLVTTTEQIEGIRAVTVKDILAVAREIFRPENRAVSWVLPK